MVVCVRVELAAFLNYLTLKVAVACLLKLWKLIDSRSMNQQKKVRLSMVGDPEEIK
jgi:hypothetical protein